MLQHLRKVHKTAKNVNEKRDSPGLPFRRLDSSHVNLCKHLNIKVLMVLMLNIINNDTCITCHKIVVKPLYLLSVFILTPMKPEKVWLMILWIITNWKILKEMGIPDHVTCLLRNLYAVRKQQLELDMEQWTGFKSGKEYIKAVYCHPAYLTYMQSTS